METYWIAFSTGSGMTLNRTIVGWKLCLREELSRLEVSLNRTIVGWKHGRVKANAAKVLSFKSHHSGMETNSNNQRPTK